MKYKDVLKMKWFWKKEPKMNCRFRFDPIPYVGNYKRCGNYYRHIRTTQERRWSIPHKDYVRGRRKYATLTNSWDDIGRNDFRDKSWKNCTKRRHQYK